MLIHDVLSRGETATSRRWWHQALLRSMTFQQLDDRVARIAALIAERTPRGGRVGILAENCAEWVELLYAVPRAGRVLVFLNERLAPREIASILRDSSASMVVGDADRIDALRQCDRELTSSLHLQPLDRPEWSRLIEDAGPHQPDGDQSVNDVAWLVYTSGTTGAPKGAMLTHRSVMTAVMANSLGRPVRHSDVYFSAYPLCHVSAMNVVVYHFHGCPTVLLRRFEADGFVRAARLEGATVTTMAPTMLELVLDRLEQEDESLPLLRRIGYGAAAIPADLHRRTLGRVDVEFTESYGMTELSGAAVFDGRPSPLVDLRLVDTSGVEVASGEVGEVEIRGDQVMAGYWNDIEATSRAFHGRWLRTGDLGVLDEQGLLTIVGRSKDIIITGGENVMPLEIESVLREHPAIAAAAVVGRPDPHWGEAVWSFVVPRAGVRIVEADVTEFVGAHLARFKIPKRVVVLTSLPVNATGKVDKRRLVDLAAETGAAQ